MIYLLVDNCSLRDMIDIQGYSKHLSIIDNLISTKKIAFVTHKLILEEWEKHKPSFKRKKERKLLSDNKQLSGDAPTSLLPSTGTVTVEHIEDQIQRIDELLNNAYIILETPDVISSEFSDRHRYKKPPFHNKRDSQNDWEIIGSFCNYCQTNGIPDLYFLSANTTDFGDPANRAHKIHPSFEERFTKVKINYFSDYFDFLSAIENLSSLSIELVRYTLIPNEKYSFKSSKRKSVLDSLYYLYNELYSEINFIPLHILAQYYPFSNSEKANAYYSIFKMFNVSERMVAFFDNIFINDAKEIYFKNEGILNPIKNYKEKTEAVLRKLTGNLIFHISGSKNTNWVRTHYYNPIKCECYRCCFNRFEFSKAFEGVTKIQPEYKNKLKQAYIHYQLGNYESANYIYNEIVEKGLEEKKFLSYFIAKYNQSQLSRFLRNFFTNKIVNDELIDELSKIDPLEEAVKLKTHTDYNFLAFIATGNFFSDAFQAINGTVANIIDYYNSQLRGGAGSNNYIGELTEEFVKLETFLNSNFLIFDSYSNFQRLFENVIEGLFASHAISKSHHSRIQFFDDYWVGKLLFYGKRKVLVRHFNTYNLKVLKYESKSLESDSFIELFANLVSDNEILFESKKVYADNNNKYFDSRFDELFVNSLTMAALLELNATVFTRFTDLLLKFLVDQKIKHSYVEALEYFLEKKGGLLSQERKHDFLDLFMAKLCKNETLVHTILEKLNGDDLGEISDGDFNILLGHSVGICNKCNQRHNSNLFVQLFEKADAYRKKIITGRVYETLEKGFDFELFYISTIFKVIKLDKERLISLITAFDIGKEQKTFKSLFSNSLNFENGYLDQIFNICFHFDIDTTSIEFSKFSKLHPYYDWLLNMENFDYENFNPEWVLHVRTVSHSKILSRSEKAKQALRGFLKNNFHIGIERVLLRVTNFVGA